MTLPRPVAAAVFVLVALVATACGTPRGTILPDPTSTSSTEPVPTTERIDYSRVGLTPLPGETTTTAPIAAGTAEIRGGVEGPTGLIPGATVRVERLVGNAVQRMDVTTGADGRYTLAGVPGGRYRVRAYFIPLLTMDGPEVFYLADGETKDLDLRTREFTGVVVTSAVTPEAPFIGQGVNLVVRVSERVVDGDGVGREVGLGGVSVAVTSTGWRPAGSVPTTTRPPAVSPGSPESPAPTTTTTPSDATLVTDANGNAVFEFSCPTVTVVTATAIVDVGTGPTSYPLDVPSCGSRPTTTTAPAVPESPDGPMATVPGATTTRP